MDANNLKSPLVQSMAWAVGRKPSSGSLLTNMIIYLAPLEGSDLIQARGINFSFIRIITAAS